MSIERLKLENFTAFEWTELEFARGINVLLGANGTGKSHVLKVLHSIAHVPPITGSELPFETIRKNLEGYFKPEGDRLARLVRGGGETTKFAKATVDYSRGNASVVLWPGHAQTVTVSPDLEHVLATFIPSRELLSMYEGFAGLYAKREVSFDQTYFDACLALNATPLIGPEAEAAAALTASLEEAIGGKVVLEGERFSVVSEGRRLEAHLMGEGLRKLASLVRLIQNGTITKGSVLFWDEPESNLNPRLTTLVGDVLVKLARQGVQIFLATHDYLLSNRLSLISEYGQAPEVPIRFFAFHRATPEAPVTVDSGTTLAELPEDPIVEEFAKHYDFERRLFAGKTAEK